MHLIRSYKKTNFGAIPHAPQERTISATNDILTKTRAMVRKLLQSDPAIATTSATRFQPISSLLRTNSTKSTKSTKNSKIVNFRLPWDYGTLCKKLDEEKRRKERRESETSKKMKKTGKKKGQPLERKTNMMHESLEVRLLRPQNLAPSQKKSWGEVRLGPNSENGEGETSGAHNVPIVPHLRAVQAHSQLEQRWDFFFFFSQPRS